MNECWSQIVAGHRALVSGPDADPLTMLFAVPMFGLLLAAMLAPWVQAAYSRRVQRMMGWREVAPPPKAWWQQRARGLQRQPPTVAAPDAATLVDAMNQRERRIRRATIAAYAVFVPFTLLPASLMKDMTPVDNLLAVVFVAMLAAGPALANVAPQGSKRLVLGGSLVVTIIALAVEKDVGLDDAAIGLSLIGLLYLASVHRTMRALIVPLMVLGGGAVLGVGASAWAVLPQKCLSAGASDHLLPSDRALIGMMFAAAVLAFVLCLWLAGRLLEALARVVHRGWLSDVSLVGAAGLAMLAAVLVMSADDARATSGAKAAMFAAWMGLTAGTYAWVLRLHPCPRQGRTLLMLRVFSRDRKAERLLDAIQARWQFAGPVLEIGGPDLAKLNLDLHELVAFVTFRLHELFQPSAVPRDMLAASLDLALDREGRFRVNELFCFDTSWRAVVEQLLGLADVVLLDLRGFGETRHGTAHEVGRLATLGLLPRVVAVIDDTTDGSSVDRCITAQGGRGSELQRIDAGARDALQSCLGCLLDIADGPPIDGRKKGSAPPPSP